MEKKTEGCNQENRADKVAAEAEACYRSGRMHCAEAVLAAVVRNYMPEAGEEIARLAAGFGGGSGAGCICGAVVGGTMAFGLVSGEDRNRVKRLTRELHRWFRAEYGETCCRVILKTHDKKCFELTGRVAGKVAELLES
ncbi:MAG TPA: C-GCAxxG-C-C family protein [Geobacteraceae bacterium]|nr:C-GCAxxG-C-C family protein [Geobacteraceae bacterium]